MNQTISALDEYFMAHYSDYVRLAALDGYRMPELLSPSREGGVQTKDPALMRLNHQERGEELLALLKREQADTDYTFSFRFLTFSEKLRRPFERYSFARVLPRILSGHSLTVEEAGRMLTVEEKFWKKMVKGTLFPEKNTVLALALACGFTAMDTENLFNACGYEFDERSVRDIVVRFLLEQRIFSHDLIHACLDEYKITSLPIK